MLWTVESALILALVTLLVVIWLTSAYWFFSTFGIKR